MSVKILKVGLLFFVLLCSWNSWALDHDHKLWTTVLQSYLNDRGLVNYKKLKNDIKNKDHDFLKYLQELEKVKQIEYQKFSKEQQMSFLINAYNAFTVKLIVDHYPVKSIKDIGGFFTKPWRVKFFSLLGGEIKSLDPIEHEWLRPKFKDYRIHAAVNCASISCPLLRKEAFIAKNLNSQLDEQMKTWISDSNRNNLNFGTHIFRLSKIFDWYEDDFKDWGGGVLNILFKHSGRKLPPSYVETTKIFYLDYDWGLNEVRK